MKDRGENAKNAIDPTTGCMGCASGKGAGPRNIFGNKYGQNLAAVLIAREKRMAAMEAKREERQRQREKEEEEEEQRSNQKLAGGNNNDDDDDAGDSETDDDTDDEDDYGPSPAAGVWAGSKKLEAEALEIAEGDEDEHEDSRPAKKMRAE